MDNTGCVPYTSIVSNYYTCFEHIGKAKTGGRLCYTKIMYVGVDIGGTNTRVASLDDNGVIKQRLQFRTPKEYEQFLMQLRQTANELESHDFRAGCVAVPGRVDRESGIALHFGNLPWRHVPLRDDAVDIFQCPIILEHDGPLGGLSESMLLPADKRVLYVTISTGIGVGLVDHRQIVPELADSEGGQMLLQYHGKRTKWESFASGHAIVERFGKKAAEIEDAETWKRIVHDLAQGFTELIAIMQPDIIVVGGSVGLYFDRFKDYLVEEVGRYHNPLVPIPEFRQAQRPDDAVIYGCYDLAKSRYGTAR